MNYRDPKLRDLLAAEYAIGTLTGGARRRFEQLLDEDPALDELVYEWDKRLARVHLPYKGQAPDKQLWRNLEKRLWGENSAASWWDSLLLWRSLSFASLIIAVVTAFSLWLPARQMMPDAVAVLGNNQVAQAWKITCNTPKSLMRITTMAYQAHPILKPELWAVVDGQAISLGFLPDSGIVTVQMDRVMTNALMSAEKLAVTMETEDNVAHPTSPEVYSGQLISL